MIHKSFLRAISLLALMVSFVPASSVGAQPSPAAQPADFFQLPWDQGLAWVAIDGIDNGTKRPLNSSHHFTVGGAIDFAPHNNMVKGEDTSNFWVTTAAAGTVVETSNCHVKIAHSNGWLTEYQFLANMQVKLGDSVSRNQRLAVIADGVRQRFCPGSAEPNVPHLHFILRPTLIGASLAGWVVNYFPVLNKTTFTKDGTTVGLFKPLLNTPIEPTTPTPTISTTATPGTGTFSPTPSSTPTREMSPTPTLFGQYVSTTVNPQTINLGETTEVTVSLNNVPLEGYTSAEFTCFYESNFLEVSNITATDLFGSDAVMAINGPHNNRFIVAIAGSNDNKASTSGAAITFNVKGLQVVQTQLWCEARVSRGDNELTQLPFDRTHITIIGSTTSTPTPNLTPPMPTVLPSTCDKVEFVADINVPPGTVMSPGTTFIKTWRLKNVGTCTWSRSYQLVFFYGEPMGAFSAVALPVNVSTGQTVDISINMTAPNAPGSYRGYWIFRNSHGIDFGIGPDANQPWFVDINVSGPTLPPSPTFTRPPASATPTIMPTACDKAQMIADVTIPDGTVMAPGTNFTKTWRLKNIGTCTWTTSYQLVFFSGEQMGSASSANFTQNVLVGQTVDVSVNLTAPNVPGSYRGYWMFKNADGALFGIGTQANKPWWVDIRVSGPTATPGPIVTQASDSPTPSATPSGPTDTPVPSVTPGGPTVTPISGVVYDFVANACSAIWSSGAGQLPCPGTDGDAKGFVLKVSNPKLESGATDPRPGILTIPQNVQNGYIQGFYPAFRVQSGDRFRSIINCEDGATNCYIAFRLEYQTGNDPIRVYWGPFLERYDGHYYSVDVDLSSLAGKDVKFILTVLAAGPATGDRALWVGPYIYRASDAVATATSATAEASATSTATTAANTYQNTKYDFKFTLPSGATIENQSDNTGRVDLPFIAGTNLHEKYIHVDIVEGANPCVSPAVGGTNNAPENVTVNNIQFVKLMGSEGAAGNLYDWVSYSTTRNNACISLAFILHSVQPGNYPTPPPVFDYATESAVFGQIISTFTWLTLAPTNTPIPTPSPSCETDTASVTLSTNHVTINVGDSFKVVVTLNNEGCVALGLPQYRLNVSPNGSDSPVFPIHPEPIVHYLAIEPGHSDSAEFNFQAVSAGWIEFTASTSYEVHLGYPGPAYWGGSSSQEPLRVLVAAPISPLTGQIIAERPVTVSFYDAWNALVASVPANVDGTYSLTAPSGTYTVVATANGFLSAQGSFTAIGWNTTILPIVTLLAGDIDNNNVIDQFDALTIGMSYNATEPTAADLNNDGIINVLDLELLAQNYRETGPVVWE